jgi:hypothetical protein
MRPHRRSGGKRDRNGGKERRLGAFAGWREGSSDTMVNLVRYAEIKALLGEVAGVADRLSPAERELFHTLAARYAEPAAGAFEDKTCLEVMLRNVEIRTGYGLKGSEATRKIDLPRKPGASE